MVIADIPGLISGAHLGKGLGTQFLGHIERCKVLLHMIDGSSETILKDYETIKYELKEYQMQLGKKPKIIAINKADAVDNEKMLDNLRLLQKEGLQTFIISSVSGEGIKELLRALQAIVSNSNSQVSENGEISQLKEKWEPI